MPAGHTAPLHLQVLDDRSMMNRRRRRPRVVLQLPTVTRASKRGDSKAAGLACAPRPTIAVFLLRALRVFSPVRSGARLSGGYPAAHLDAGVRQVSGDGSPSPRPPAPRPDQSALPCAHHIAWDPRWPPRRSRCGFARVPAITRQCKELCPAPESERNPPHGVHGCVLCGPSPDAISGSMIRAVTLLLAIAGLLCPRGTGAGPARSCSRCCPAPAAAAPGRDAAARSGAGVGQGGIRGGQTLYIKEAFKTPPRSPGGYDKKPSAPSCFNAAVAFERPEIRAGLQFFEKYLEKDPEAKDAKEVKERIEGIKACCPAGCDPDAPPKPEPVCPASTPRAW